jgi:hypothetical protein
MGTWGSFPGGKVAGHEADHSPPSSAEVKNEWNYTSIPQYVFMAWCLLKHRGNFTFTVIPFYNTRKKQKDILQKVIFNTVHVTCISEV